MTASAPTPLSSSSPLPPPISDEQLHAAMPLLTSGEVEKLHRHWLEKIRSA